MSKPIPVLSKLMQLVNWRGVTNEPEVDATKLTNADFVLFGRYNLFPETCLGLTYNCVPLNTCVQTLTRYIAGEGIEFLVDENKVDEKATALWAELTRNSPDILTTMAYGHVLMNARAWEVIYKGGGAIDEIAPMDVVRVRSGKKDEDGLVPAYYWNDDWQRWSKERTKYPEQKVLSFDLKGRKDKAIMYRRGRGNDYYGYPKWIAAMTDAEVLSRIPVFNRTQIDTGFRPATHIHIFTNKDSKELGDIRGEIEQFLTGADAQTFAVTHGPTAEGAPVINKLDRGDHAGELDHIGNRSELVLYKAFGLPPLLAGVDVNTGMSGKGLAIEQTLTMFQRTRIAPDQRLLAGDVIELLAAAGHRPNIARIRPLTPFDAATDVVLNRQTYIARTTVNQDLIANGREPLKPGDKRGDMLLVEVLRGGLDSTNDPAVSQP